MGASNSQPATHGEVRGQARVSVQVTRVTSTCHLFFEREPLTSLELHQAGRARGPQPPEGYLCLPPTSLMLGFTAHTAGIYWVGGLHTWVLVLTQHGFYRHSHLLGFIVLIFFFTSKKWKSPIIDSVNVPINVFHTSISCQKSKWLK